VLREEAAQRTAEGNYNAAIERYETAARLGAPPDVYRQLALLYAKVGRVGEAERAQAEYDKAVKGDPALRR